MEWMPALQLASVEEVDVTEQNYTEGGAINVGDTSITTAGWSQLDQLLQRIATLELQVAELQQQLAQAQGGIETFPG